MQHEYETHVNCERPACLICEGGLRFCKICSCGEGSLATDCPGFPVPQEVQTEIHAGRMDFLHGVWSSNGV